MFTCRGARLSQAALACNQRTTSPSFGNAGGELIPLPNKSMTRWATLVESLSERLQHLVDIGLDYLSLNRETATLSGGESQRVKMVKHLSGSLVDVMYVFDEPSVGLHPRDVHRLNELLQKLRDKGNSVIVVEHDREVMKVADHIVDVGPHAGNRGGTIVYQGDFAGLLQADTLTGRHLQQSLPIKESFRAAKGKLSVVHARANNLRMSVRYPHRRADAVTGVVRGKSSLIHQVFLHQHPDAIVIYQSQWRFHRSNPATYRHYGRCAQSLCHDQQGGSLFQL